MKNILSSVIKDALKKLNNITSNTLSIGQKLLLP